MSRELTLYEQNAATWLCRQRGWTLQDGIHGVSFTGDEGNSAPCPTCRADVVRLVDGEPPAPLRVGVPEVSEMTMRWVRERNERTVKSAQAVGETTEKNAGDWAMQLQFYRELLAAVEYVAALGRGK